MYESSDPLVAEVDAEGLVAALSSGQTTVTATNGASTDDVTVTVGNCTDAGCDDGNPCTQDSGEPVTGCTNTFSIDYCGDTFALKAVLTVDPSAVVPGAPVAITVEASDDVGVQSLSRLPLFQYRDSKPHAVEIQRSATSSFHKSLQPERRRSHLITMPRLKPACV